MITYEHLWRLSGSPRAFCCPLNLSAGRAAGGLFSLPERATRVAGQSRRVGDRSCPSKCGGPYGPYETGLIFASLSALGDARVTASLGSSGVGDRSGERGPAGQRIWLKPTEVPG